MKTVRTPPTLVGVLAGFAAGLAGSAPSAARADNTSESSMSDLIFICRP
jgi:hypothetical protein